MIYDIAIIGGGASGLMLASLLPKDLKIAIIEKNSAIGQKIKISGGSKCNVTNEFINSSHYLGEQSFIEQVLENLSVKQLLEFLKKNGVHPHLNEKIVKGTFFCKSSQEMLNMFTTLTKHCHIHLNCEVLDVQYDELYTLQTTTKNILAKKLVIASGGLSYPSLGASGIGFDIAKKFGHTINTLNPALVGFTVQKEQFWFKQLSGLSLEVAINVENKRLEGSLLFTHKGCSGPVVLSASLYWKKGTLQIDFLPKKDSYLPKRFLKAFKENCGDEKNYKKLLRSYTMAPAGNFGYTKAEVTKGGVDTSQIQVDSMESKLQKDLYILGEVLDATGELGGYNFHWAFSTAFTCAKHLKGTLCA